MQNSMDQQFIEKVSRLARDSVANNGGPFAALVVKDNQVIAEGTNLVTLNNDPTAHAEVIAIRRACEKLQDYRLTGCTLYASCEPCPMCMSAIYWSRLDRVVFVNTRHDAHRAGFDDDMIAKEVCLPHEQKSLAVEHAPTQGGDACFIDWLEKEDRQDY